MEDGGWGACILREFCISNMFWLMTEHLEKHPKKCIAKKLQNYRLSFKHKTNLNQTPHFFFYFSNTRLSLVYSEWPVFLEPF